MMRAGTSGAARRVLAALLVFALLALSALPASAWQAPSLAGHAGAHHDLADCGEPGAMSDAPAQRPARHHHDDVPPGLACCLALHCPMLLAGLPAASPMSTPPGDRTDDAVRPMRQPAGLDIPPDLPPPRDAA